MKKVFVIIIVILALVSGYYLVRNYWLPAYVARQIVLEEEVPTYIPEKFRKRILTAKKKVNPLVEAVLLESYKHGLTFEELINFVETADAEVVFAFADSVSAMKELDRARIFDMGNEMLKPPFNPEPLRGIFYKHATNDLMKRAVKHYRENREVLQSSAEVGRQILKQILIEKDKQVRTLIDN